ncbi:MAG: hypothetical protein U9Q33_11785 [Campylobacterota bacterium]|nr:hypothetical protein [Campylobacterota bacterium]
MNSNLEGRLRKYKLGDIKGFWIEDNGSGFNKKNFDAFQELDTLNKINKGGKDITDLTTTFETIVETYFGWLIKSSDRTAYFGYEPIRKTYFEIISYEKLLKDVINRNKIFFEKPGI